MKRSFTWKLTVSVCLILVLFSAGVVVSEQHQEKKYKTEALEERLDDYAQMIYRFIGSHSDGQTFRMDSLLALLPANLRLTIIDNAGNLLYDNRLDDFSKAGNHAGRPEIREAAQNGNGSDIRLSASVHREYLYYAKYMGDKYIRVALPYDIQVRHFLKPDNAFFYYLFLLFLVGIVFIYYIEINKHIAEDYKRVKESETKLTWEQARNNRLKQELTGNIAHELRTPVTGIRGYLETILENQLSREKEQEFVSKAYDQIITLSELIRDMSLLSKISEAPDSFQFQPLSLQSIINKVQADLEAPLLARDIIVHSTLPMDLMVSGNENLLYSVFRNLIDNVINYAGESVTIQIDKYNQAGKTAYFSFSDNGVGISDEKHLTRLFERFYRVEEGRSRDTGGSGLGLSIVKNVIIFHGGTVSVKNRVTGGLEFLFSLQTD